MLADPSYQLIILLGPIREIIQTAKPPTQLNTTPPPRKPVGPSVNPTTQKRPQTPRLTRPRIIITRPTTASTQSPRTTDRPTRVPTRATRPTRPHVVVRTTRSQVVLRTTQERRVTAEPTQELTKTPGRLSTILFPTKQTNEDADIHGMSKPANIVRGPEDMSKLFR